MSNFKPSTREEFDAMWAVMNEAGRKEYAWEVSALADGREMVIRSEEARVCELEAAVRALLDDPEAAPIWTDARMAAAKLLGDDV